MGNKLGELFSDNFRCIFAFMISKAKMQAITPEKEGRLADDQPWP